MSRRRRIRILVGVAAALGLALVVTLVPIPSQPFRLDGATIPDLWTWCEGIYATRGTTVTFQWTADAPTTFSVVRCSPGEGQIVYFANGTRGSGEFVAQGAGYKFGALCPGPTPCHPANVTGTKTGPLVAIWNCAAYVDLAGRTGFHELCFRP